MATHHITLKKLDKIIKEETAKVLNENGILKALTHKLKTHDWWYQMSDDPRVWSRGKKSNDELTMLVGDAVAAGLGTEAQKLYNKFAPKEFKGKLKKESVNEVKVKYDFSEQELVRVLRQLKRGASTEINMIKAFEKALGRKITDKELYELKKESVNEALWPKSKLSDRFQFLLAPELKKLGGFFHVIGYDLYRNDKKLFTINPDKDGVNTIVSKVKKIKESVNEGKKIHIGTDMKSDVDYYFDTGRGIFYANVIDGAGNRTNKLNYNTIFDLVGKVKSFKWTKAGKNEFPEAVDESVNEAIDGTSLNRIINEKVESFVEKLTEGKWSKIMQGVRKNPQGPFSVVVIKNGKVVGQSIDIKDPQLIPAKYEDMKRKHPGARISIENGEGNQVYFEGVNESMDQKKRFQVYDKLKKGDEITLKYSSVMGGEKEGKFIVSKGKTKVGKAQVERIILKNVANPKGVKYYLYNRNGDITLAIGDMAANIKDIRR